MSDRYGVLVTGASTPLGRALVGALLEEPRVTAILAVAREPRWGTPTGKKLTYQAADLTRSRDLRRLLFGPARQLGVRAVIHAAFHRSAVESSPRIHALNVETTRELLHLAERHPTIRRFVYRSFADVYRLRPEGGGVLGEEHPLELGKHMPDGVRDRVEADLTVCTRMGLAPSLSIAVLRCAELLAPDSGSQLYDYLGSRVCFRPLGFDPMTQVLSIDDAVQALLRAALSDAQGVFNVPGADVLPLSRVVSLAGRRGVPVPAPLLGPLYAARRIARDTQFSYSLNRFRFHVSGVLDGHRAKECLGYRPEHPIDWAELRRQLRYE
jgi:UDP-glucose 4-epimerase